MNSTLKLWAAAIALATANPALATGPTMYFTGTLLNNCYNPVETTTAKVAIALYDTPSGGTSLCAATYENVNITTGRFSIPLPALCNAQVRKNPQAYVEVTIDDVPFTPRQRIGAVPTAINGSLSAVILTDSDLTAPQSPGGQYTYVAQTNMSYILKTAAFVPYVVLPANCITGDEIRLTGASSTGWWAVGEGDTLVESSSLAGQSALGTKSGFPRTSTTFQCIEGTPDSWSVVSTTGELTRESGNVYLQAVGLPSGSKGNLTSVLELSNGNLLISGAYHPTSSSTTYAGLLVTTTPLGEVLDYEVLGGTNRTSTVRMAQYGEQYIVVGNQDVSGVNTKYYKTFSVNEDGQISVAAGGGTTFGAGEFSDVATMNSGHVIMAATDGDAHGRVVVLDPADGSTLSSVKTDVPKASQITRLLIHSSGSVHIGGIRYLNSSYRTYVQTYSTSGGFGNYQDWNPTSGASDYTGALTETQDGNIRQWVNSIPSGDFTVRTRKLTTSHGYLDSGSTLPETGESYIRYAFVTPDGTTFACGYHDKQNAYDAWIIRTDDDGGLVWDRKLGLEGKSTHFYHGTHLSDGRLVFVGQGFPSESTEFGQHWIYFTNPDGE